MSYESIITSLQYSNRKPSNRDWEVSEDDGWSVAHFWVQHHLMPADFPYWELADQDGWTVAHAAAQSGRLPVGFDKWLLADKKGDTVAHIAARNNLFPVKAVKSDVLTARNHEGISVWDIIKERDKSRFDQLKAILAT